MGESQFWYRETEIDQDKFNAIVRDFKKVARRRRYVIRGWDGTGKPTITSDEIWFNGEGERSASAMVLNRVYEPRKNEPQYYGLWFNHCKTYGFPYDVLVQSLLIICQHHIGERFKVSSNHPEKWDKARKLCMSVLGYGSDFELFEEEED